MSGDEQPSTEAEPSAFESALRDPATRERFDFSIAEEAKKFTRSVSIDNYLNKQERYVWIILSIAPLLFVIRSYFENNSHFSLFNLIFPTQGIPAIAISFFIILFPILFRLIFGFLPFASFRNARKNASDATLTVSGSISRNVSPDSVLNLSEKRLDLRAIEIAKLNPRELLAFYAEQTADITKKIYTRAGVYLLVGVLISFIGLAVFYIRTGQNIDYYGVNIKLNNQILNSVNTENEIYKTMINDIADRATNLLPGFGILFFIEFIAFFFLRQYRSAMDEFRYFDSVRRSREESLVILKMFSENPNIVATKDVIDAMRIYSSAGVIDRNQTTDILESRKMQKDELIIFEKLTDAISSFRNSETKDSKEKKR